MFVCIRISDPHSNLYQTIGSKILYIIGPNGITKYVHLEAKFLNFTFCNSHVDFLTSEKRVFFFFNLYMQFKINRV